MEYQQCKRCVMDNISDKSIHFDQYGYCNYCSDSLKRLKNEYFPNDDKEFLIKKFDKIKATCKNDSYDCIVGLSGGIDSSYILYLGYKYGLRMLAVHIDDGLDNPIAIRNINKLVDKTNTKLVVVRPNKEEYADVLYSMFKASVPTLANAQDNLIIKYIQDYGEKNNIKYSLDGSNFPHECILERSNNNINACDGKYIRSVQKRYGRIELKEIEFFSLIDRYIIRHFKKNFIHFRPLNYIDYNLEQAIIELKDFCGFEYYGGKHYESILTRFLQCYYLPTKFGIDKRKSHFSSLIVSGQMTREEALKKLELPLYSSSETFEEDKKYLANYLGITVEDFEELLSLPPKNVMEYSSSILNRFAFIARKFRKFID